MATASIPKGFKLVPTDDDEKTPEARGKAAALSSYLAKKGSPKGNRLDRHTARFEQMWEKAPVALKEKYARRSQKTDLAPSERGGPPIQGPPKDMSSAAIQKRRMASYGHEFDANGNAVPINRPKVPATGEKGSTFSDLTKAPVVPADGIKSVGDDSSPESEAKRQGKPMPDLAGKTMEQQRAALMKDARQNPPTAKPPIKLDGSILAQDTGVSDKPVSAPDDSTPISRGLETVGRKVSEWAEAATVLPKQLVTPDVEFAKGNKARLDAQTAQQAQVDSAAQERAKQIAHINGQPVPAPAPAQAPVAGQPASPYTGPMSAKPSPAPVAGQPPIPSPTYRGPLAQGATPTGSPVLPTPMSTTGKPMDNAIKSDQGGGLTRVSATTGLPFGFRPGDALPKSANADMQQRAGDSQIRQSQAQAAARPAAPIAGPMRGPASQPLRTGSSLDNPNSAFSKEAYQRSNAAVAQGVAKQATLEKAQNVDDPNKFFTGRTLPLDQLVKNQKIRTIAPARPPMLARR